VIWTLLQGRLCRRKLLRYADGSTELLQRRNRRWIRYQGPARPKVAYSRVCLNPYLFLMMR
jgi:hypothetical protein